MRSEDSASSATERSPLTNCFFFPNMTTTLLASDLNQLVWEFLLSGGVFMLLIVLCSLVAAAIVIHRLLSLRRGAVMPRELLEKLRDASGPLDGNQRAALRADAVESESALGEIACAAFSDDCESADEAMNTTEAVARKEVLRLQSGLSILEDVIIIAPLLGLLGTVSGLVLVFAELGDSESVGADPKVLAEGIARALNTTIAGLAVTVPTVVARTYFHKKIEAMAVRMEILFGRLIHARYRNAPDSEIEEKREPKAATPTPSSTEKFQPRPPVEEAASSGDVLPAPAPAPARTPAPAAATLNPASLDELPAAAPQPGAEVSNAPPPGPAGGGRIVPQQIPRGDGHSQQAPTEKPAE